MKNLQKLRWLGLLQGLVCEIMGWRDHRHAPATTRSSILEEYSLSIGSAKDLAPKP